MARAQSILRLARRAGLCLLVLILVFWLAVRTDMSITRFRAERLMADMHQIRLYQSTWADAQRLMTRWGAWGHYDGSCTAQDCRYTITIDDQELPLSRILSSNIVQSVFQYTQYLPYVLLGGRNPQLVTSFTVHNNTIWRTNAFVILAVPSEFWRSESERSGYGLIVRTQSLQRLHETRDSWPVLGRGDQLVDHPYYKAGRPSGCEVCEGVVVTYSTRAPPTEIERLTTFNFSCFTSLLPCRELDDLLPAARPWHLYDDAALYDIAQRASHPPRPCDIPLWALGRDQANIFVVDALSTAQMQGDISPVEVDKARAVEALKGSLPRPPGTILEAQPFQGEFQYPPLRPAEHLVPGHRYIVLPREDNGDRVVEFDHGNGFTMDRCGVHPDTPQNRHELEQGYAENDTLVDREGGF